MTWLLVLAQLAANLLRLGAGIALAARRTQAAPGRQTLALAALGGAAVTLVQQAGGAPVLVLGAEAAVVAAAAAGRRDRLRPALFLAVFYEMGAALWEFLLAAWTGILAQQAGWTAAAAPAPAAGVWLTRLLLVLLVLADRRRALETTPLVTAAGVLGFFGAVTLSQQRVLPLEEDLVSTWILLATLLLVALLVHRLNRQRELAGEVARLKQAQADILERDYQALRRTYADNAKLYHDLHNHIEVLCHCLDEGDLAAARRYCQDLRGPVEEMAHTVWTGDPAVDHLITSKTARAQALGAQTQVNVEFPRNTDIRGVDLTAILGNLLDNALEALAAAPADRRLLRLTIRRIQQTLIIKVENSYGQAPHRDQGALVSAKKDRTRHGWGLKSVQAAAERYEGVLQTDWADGVFRAVVTLSFRPVKLP